MKRHYFKLTIACLLFIFPELAAAGYELSWWTADSGGQGSSGAYTMTGTVGQADAGTVSGGSYAMRGGFWIMMPDITVRQGTTPILNGAGNQDFGSVPLGNASAAVMFTIENSGTAALSLTGIRTLGDNSGDFTVTQPVSSTIMPGGVTTFTIAFAPTAPGTRAATISIAGNDSDEASYTFTVTGTGQAQANNSFLLWTK